METNCVFLVLDEHACNPLTNCRIVKLLRTGVGLNLKRRKVNETNIGINLNSQGKKSPKKSPTHTVVIYITSLVTNSKQCWSFIRTNKTENIGIPSLKVNDMVKTTDSDKAMARRFHN